MGRSMKKCLLRYLVIYLCIVKDLKLGHVIEFCLGYITNNLGSLLLKNCDVLLIYFYIKYKYIHYKYHETILKYKKIALQMYNLLMLIF